RLMRMSAGVMTSKAPAWACVPWTAAGATAPACKQADGACRCGRELQDACLLQDLDPAGLQVIPPRCRRTRSCCASWPTAVYHRAAQEGRLIDRPVLSAQQ